MVFNAYLVSLSVSTTQEEMMKMKNVDTIVTIPSIAGFLLVFQLIYWFTLFESLSFYITLIIESLIDIKEFLVILMCCLASFANASIIVENNYAIVQNFKLKSQENAEMTEGDLTSTRFKNQFIDNLFTQWLLGLGEFEMLGLNDESEGENQSIKILLWIYFILATIITQIILFNTLIAIISDSYGRIMDKRSYYAVKAKTEIYADFMYYIRIVNGIEKFTQNRYLYLI
jgi:hypothetical protein